MPENLFDGRFLLGLLSNESLKEDIRRVILFRLGQIDELVDAGRHLALMDESPFEHVERYAHGPWRGPHRAQLDPSVIEYRVLVAPHCVMHPVDDVTTGGGPRAVVERPNALSNGWDALRGLGKCSSESCVRLAGAAPGAGSPADRTALDWLATRVPHA